VADIIPWNVPLLFFPFKVSAAVAVGNTFVLKTSEKAPLICTRVAAMVKEAGSHLALSM
jgi:acyl-CoA reductase-like NAD-dependent aldehyde dehydrogenase